MIIWIVAVATAGRVAVGRGVGGARFILIATVRLESICILALLPYMLKTGPIHSSTYHPCLGSMYMVTPVPCE